MLKKIQIFLILNFVFILTGTSFIFAGENVKKIGVMIYGSHNIVTYEGFKKGLKEKGFIEGKNIEFIYNGVYKTQEHMLDDMIKIVELEPDLIFTSTTPASLAAYKATLDKKIPVVFAPVGNPYEIGIVQSLKQPSGNLTGVMLTDSTAKQIEWMVRIDPTIKRILIPYNPEDPSAVLSYKKALEASRIFNLDLFIKKVRTHEDIDNLFKNKIDNIDGIFLPRDGLIMQRVNDIAEYGKKYGFVLSGTRLEMAEEGALFGFGFSGDEIGKQAARIAIQILKDGMDPGVLPVETSEDYLAINIKTADSLGIKISEHILRQAHIIIRE